jgi:hypothetical protein
MKLRILSLSLVATLLALVDVQAQFEARFMAVGSLHSWFANTGCEIEEGRIRPGQQDGLQWPAIYRYQDMEAAKGFWIGCKNFTDPTGTNYEKKVIHIGPRVKGVGAGPDGGFFPTRFETISQVDPPTVYVDGAISEGKSLDNTDVDPTMKADRMIINEANTSIGLKMTRKILAFSQGFHDNYFIYDYTFTNTGNTDDDPEIELPNITLTGVYFFYQYRYAVCRETRYLYGNATGWGINTMNDTRGDGVKPDPPGQNVRAQFAYQGKYPVFTAWDNLGGPIFRRDTEKFINAEDTVGRLGNAQFVGVATLLASRSATDSTDDPAQPRTTTYVASDDPLNSQNDQFNTGKMALEYAWMEGGHANPRHADRVEPSGNFNNPTGDPSLPGTAGASGGWSSANGYGPYTIGPGQSIRIIMAEGASGLSRARCISIGARYKAGTISAVAKNDSFLTGKDSLFQTFRRAIANYQSGYSIPQPPLPPKSFNVSSGGDKISLSWTTYGSGPTVAAWRVYRTVGAYYGPDSLIAELPGSVTSYDDLTPVRGVSYYYYMQAVGEASANTGGGLTPPGVPLKSNRIYTQAFDAAFLKRPAGPALGPFGNTGVGGSQIRIVPNPYVVSAYVKIGDEGSLLFPGETDKIAFYNIPGRCTIKIYTELGELIKEIVHTDGSGDASWNSVTSSNQVVVSGVYIAVVEDLDNGNKAIEKFVVIR